MDESCRPPRKTRHQILFLLPPFLPPSLPPSPPVSTTSAQTPTHSSQDSCSSVYSYFQSHPSCYVYDTREGGCSGFNCSWNNSFLEVNVEECQDPVTVAVHYDSYYSGYVEFQYVYDQSEIVDNYGQVDTGRYSGILARNASHLGFEVYIIIYIIIIYNR